MHKTKRRNGSNGWTGRAAVSRAFFLCGLSAANNILLHRKVPAISRDEMEKVAHEMADKEVALLYSSSPGTVLDLAADPRGNYAVDVLLSTIASHTTMKFERWKENDDIFSNTLLVGCGEHWQAVLKDSQEGKWYVHEERSKTAIQNLVRFLTNKLKHGAVYQFLDTTDTNTTPPQSNSRKRPLDNTSPTLLPGKRQIPMQDFRLPVVPKRKAPPTHNLIPRTQPCLQSSMPQLLIFQCRQTLTNHLQTKSEKISKPFSFCSMLKLSTSTTTPLQS